MRVALFAPSVSLVLSIAILSGCGLVFDDDRQPDGGTRADGGARDAAAPTDGSAFDASAVDASAVDASFVDAGVDGGDDAGPGSPDAGPAPDGSVGCASNSDCVVTDYCRREVGSCLGEGRCTPRPAGACPAVAMPVCGCNWITYGNPCEAQLAGASIQSTGECAPPVGAEWCALTPAAPRFGICTRCFDDADCGGFLPYCVATACQAGGEGICAPGPLAAGDCYTDLDCRESERCHGAVIDECLPSQGSCVDR